MKIAIAQINPTVGDLTGNQKKILEFIRKAREKKAELVLFPELAVTGYPPEDLLLKKHFVDENIRTLQGIAKMVKGITAVIGFVDASGGFLYNAAAVISGGKITGIYHKRELPNYGVFDEKRYFTQGRTKNTFKAGKVSFDLSICEDIWVEPKKSATTRSKLLINISSSPFDVEKLGAREKILKRNAQKSKSFVVYANLVGGQDELIFDGKSMAVSPDGVIFCRAKDFEEDLAVAEIDFKKKSYRTAEPEHPQTIERIYKALVLGTRDYIRKNGFKKVIIGLSGGIDSSLVAAVAVKAIGPVNVIGLTMASQYTSKETNADAKKLAAQLGIQILEIPIGGIFESYLTALQPHFLDKKADLTEENIQARIRGNLLMALSNKFGWLVLTTGNKSEVAVGYCTLYGDMSGGFAVIKDVPKTVVYELAKFINQKRVLIPESVISRAPSAELRENQKDQDSLPPYEILDDILDRYVSHHESLSQISKKHSPRLAKDIIRKIDLSEYKRRQSPPGIKITPRAFGKDWRLPITNQFKEY